MEGQTRFSAVPRGKLRRLRAHLVPGAQVVRLQISAGDAISVLLSIFNHRMPPPSAAGRTCENIDLQLLHSFLFHPVSPSANHAANPGLFLQIRGASTPQRLGQSAVCLE